MWLEAVAATLGVAVVQFVASGPDPLVAKDIGLNRYNVVTYLQEQEDDMLRRSLRDFNQSPSHIKNLAAVNGAVLLTNRGKPEFVLLTIGKYENITRENVAKSTKLSDLIAMDEGPEMDFSPERYSFDFRPPEL